ncbi:hypothetical protein D3C72_2028200 [compost metagenome]
MGAGDAQHPGLQTGEQRRDGNAPDHQQGRHGQQIQLGPEQAQGQQRPCHGDQGQEDEELEVAVDEDRAQQIADKACGTEGKKQCCDQHRRDVTHLTDKGLDKGIGGKMCGRRQRGYGEGDQ